MRLFLQQPPAPGEASRYVRLILQPDLFGGWELLRESGQVGGRQQLRRDLYLAQAEATAAFDKAHATQLKRGFVPVPAAGDELPA